MTHALTSRRRKLDLAAYLRHLEYQRSQRRRLPSWHARYHIDSHVTRAPWPHGRHRAPERTPGASWSSIAAALLHDYCQPTTGTVTALTVMSSCASVSVLAALGGWTP